MTALLSPTSPPASAKALIWNVSKPSSPANNVGTGWLGSRTRNCSLEPPLIVMQAMSCGAPPLMLAEIGLVKPRPAASGSVHPAHIASHSVADMPDVSMSS
ncbi:MAG: hypothetical protein R2690_02680 [Acidimicrobiales bacterium]